MLFKKIKIRGNHIFERISGDTENNSVCEYCKLSFNDQYYKKCNFNIIAICSGFNNFEHSNIGYVYAKEKRNYKRRN